MGVGSQIYRYDPTRTLTLRTRFAAELKRRFVRIEQAIIQKIVKDNFFHPRTMIFQADERFPLDPEKILLFMQWLQKQVDTELLVISSKNQYGSALYPSWQGFYVQSWMNAFIDQAYAKGMERGKIELERAGYTPEQAEALMMMPSAFRGPMHVDRVGAIYSRMYTSLKGITADMDARISNILALGMATHQSARELAKQLVKEVGLAEQRAERIARTEMVRAHHRAMVQMYRNLAVPGVYIMAELKTAGDDRVCQVCHDLENRLYTLDEVENLIPIHPLCRCVCLPISVSEARARMAGGYVTDGLTTMPSMVE
jgi:SPP1 gp7 family putative phage head morphogenesis protein